MGPVKRSAYFLLEGQNTEELPRLHPQSRMTANATTSQCLAQCGEHDELKMPCEEGME